MGGEDVQQSKYVSGLIVTTAVGSSKVNARMHRVLSSLFPCKTDLCAILFHLGDGPSRKVTDTVSARSARRDGVTHGQQF
jgi:hypothetical protein